MTVHVKVRVKVKKSGGEGVNKGNALMLQISYSPIRLNKLEEECSGRMIRIRAGCVKLWMSCKYEC